MTDDTLSSLFYDTTASNFLYSNYKSNLRYLPIIPYEDIPVHQIILLYSSGLKKIKMVFKMTAEYIILSYLSWQLRL